MVEQFRWIDTVGGPHILAPIECLGSWGGIEGFADLGPDDGSDYARACKVKGWLGKIPSGANSEVVVLSGDVGSVAWFRNADGDGGLLVQWLGCDGEQAILALLSGWEALGPKERIFAEALKFDTGKSGTLMLFDATVRGSEIASSGLKLDLPPGHYEMRAVLFKTDNCEVVLREIRAALN
jgi:hypothetical protein